MPRGAATAAAPASTSATACAPPTCSSDASGGISVIPPTPERASHVLTRSSTPAGTAAWWCTNAAGIACSTRTPSAGTAVAIRTDRIVPIASRLVPTAPTCSRNRPPCHVSKRSDEADASTRSLPRPLPRSPIALDTSGSPPGNSTTSADPGSV